MRALGLRFPPCRPRRWARSFKLGRHAVARLVLEPCGANCLPLPALPLALSHNSGSRLPKSLNSEGAGGESNRTESKLIELNRSGSNGLGLDYVEPPCGIRVNSVQFDATRFKPCKGVEGFATHHRKAEKKYLGNCYKEHAVCVCGDLACW